MQIIEIYGKNSDLRVHNKNLFKTMEKYFSKYPAEYRKLYDRHLKTLQIFKCDRLDDEYTDGMYEEAANIIFFTKNKVLGHEVFHMASFDEDKCAAAFESDLGCEGALLEGMTEYSHMMAFGLKEPDSYQFEVFSAQMLDTIPNLFEPYFIPNHDKFISLFPNKKDIYNLMFSLVEYGEEEGKFWLHVDNGMEGRYPGINLLRGNIRNTIDNLIKIELSFKKDNAALKEYGNKFMDIIGSGRICDELTELYPNYYDYAEKRIKERILKR